MGFLAALFFSIVAWIFGVVVGIKTERDGWVKATGEPTAEAFAAKRAEQMKSAPLKVSRVHRSAEIGETMLCAKCQIDISRWGSPVCAVCDPDLRAIIEGRAEAKSPNLCLSCFHQHCEEHEQANQN